MKEFYNKDLVPHSQCSLRENTKFLQKSRPKNNTLTESVCHIFSFNIHHGSLGLTFKSKKLLFMSQNCVYYLRENFQNVCQKCRLAL